jgi:hypothetical protein
VIPPDAPVYGRYDDLMHAKLACGGMRRATGDGGGVILYRVRWVPVAHWPGYPWAIVMYPWWRRFDADAIAPTGELIAPQLLDQLWRCVNCAATWLCGLACPNCGTTVPRDEWPPLEPSTEPTWLTLT